MAHPSKRIVVSAMHPSNGRRPIGRLVTMPTAFTFLLCSSLDSAPKGYFVACHASNDECVVALTTLNGRSHDVWAALEFRLLRLETNREAGR